jgi:hypothetical protein
MSYGKYYLDGRIHTGSVKERISRFHGVHLIETRAFETSRSNLIANRWFNENGNNCKHPMHDHLHPIPSAAPFRRLSSASEQQPKLAANPGIDARHTGLLICVLL